MRAVPVLLSLFCGVANVRSDPGEGILLGKTTVSPYVEATAGYDSNVAAAEDLPSDTWIGGRIGVTAIRTTKATSIAGEIWGLVNRYNEHDEKDTVDIGESLTVGGMLFNRVALSVRQEYSKSSEGDDFLTDFTEDIRNIVGNIAVNGSLSDRLDAGLAYQVRGNSYEDEGLFDWQQQTIGLTLDYRLTEATSVGLWSELSVTDSEGQAGEANGYSEHLGFKTVLTDKTDAMFGVGWQHLDSTPEVSTPSVKSGLKWQATEKLGIGLDGDVRIQPSVQYEDNNIIVGVGRLGATIRLTDAIATSVICGYQQNRYQSEVVTTEREGRLVENILLGWVNVSYAAPLEFLTVFLAANYVNKDSRLDLPRYERYRISLGVRLQY